MSSQPLYCAPRCIVNGEHCTHRKTAMNERDGRDFAAHGRAGRAHAASVDWGGRFDSARNSLLRSKVRKRRLPHANGPRRLARPRTSPFHGGNTGSNPVGDANKINGFRESPLFFMIQFDPLSLVRRLDPYLFSPT